MTGPEKHYPRTTAELMAITDPDGHVPMLNLIALLGDGDDIEAGLETAKTIAIKFLRRWRRGMLLSISALAFGIIATTLSMIFWTGTAIAGAAAFVSITITAYAAHTLWILTRPSTGLFLANILRSEAEGRELFVSVDDTQQFLTSQNSPWRHPLPPTIH